jgi:hypothetical protein
MTDSAVIPRPDVLPADVLQIDTAFAAEAPFLVAAGWLIAPDPRIKRVALVAADGTLLPVSYHLRSQERPEVLAVIQDRIPAGSSFAAFVLLIDAAEMESPHLLQLELEDGIQLMHELSPALAVPVADGEKRDFLKGFHAQDRTFTRGGIDWWCRVNDQLSIATGWFAGYEPSISLVIQTETAGVSCAKSQLLTFRRVDEDRRSQPAVGFVLRFPTTPERPLYLRPWEQSANSRNLVFPGTPAVPEEFIDRLADIYGHSAEQFDLLPERRTEADAFFQDLLTSVRKLTVAGSGIVDEVVFGARVSNPVVSVIVPLGSYRAGLFRLQIQKLVADPFVAVQDLVFIVSAGHDAPVYKALFDRLTAMYRFSARLLIVNKAAGFANLANLATGKTVARYLLFLDPAVIPGSASWLTGMLSQLKTDPAVGIVGARLLFHDGSISHVGLGWKPVTKAGASPIATYPLQGLDQEFCPFSGIVDVPAISAKCLLVSAELFAHLGRFDAFFFGELFDHDLCLRARRTGKRVVCDHRPLLYYVEEPNRLAAPRGHALYNIQRLQNRWGKSLFEDIQLSSELFDASGRRPL